MLTEIKTFLRHPYQIQLTPAEIERVQAARQTVAELFDSGRPTYGINTGFGKLAQVRIPPEDLTQLQINLLLSHACGVGEAVPIDIVRLMMFLKIKSLTAGYSGCSLGVVEKLIELLNKGILPWVPQQGSVGASGDLAPLAHLSLPLIGAGEVFYQNKRWQAAELVQQGVYQPVELGPKDGLALINGTQYSTALLTYAYLQAEDLLLLTELGAAMSVEALLGTDVSFQEEIQNVRCQVGQKVVAHHLRNFLKDSQIVASHKNCDKVQDPYSLRCIPQVIGAVRDTMGFVATILENETDAVSDNPLVFSDQHAILSGGNFHAEPVALAADYLTIALTILGNLSERRIALLMDSDMSGLPPFLIKKSGINTGFMIAHVTAAALCAENRTMSMPASVENIPTSANQEDHVSMAPNACLKLMRVIENLKTIIWIEFLAAAQGMEFRKPLEGGKGTRLALQQVRRLVPFLEEDRAFYPDLNQRQSFFADRDFIGQIQAIAEL